MWELQNNTVIPPYRVNHKTLPLQIHLSKLSSIIKNIQKRVQPFTNVSSSNLHYQNSYSVQKVAFIVNYSIIFFFSLRNCTEDLTEKTNCNEIQCWQCYSERSTPWYVSPLPAHCMCNCSLQSISRGTQCKEILRMNYHSESE